MSSLIQDLRFALRQFRKSPAFTVTVVVTLALGIGANAAVFTLFDQVLLRMLPVRDASSLVRFEWHGSFSGSTRMFGGNTGDYFSYPMYKDLRDRNQVFSGMLATMRTGVGVSWHNQAETEDTEIVSGNYFQVLGLDPAAGRLFTQADDTGQGANPVLVLSYDYWKTRFAGDPNVIGQTALINGHSFTILGVAPRGFYSAIGGYHPGVFVPISMADVAMPWMAPRKDLENRRSLWLTIVARLNPGVSRERAEASLNALWKSIRAEELTLFSSESPKFAERYVDKATIKVLDDARGFAPDRADLKTPLTILMSMAGLLALMCAINVATLLLLRSAMRSREMGMRYALGASRGRIVAQVVLEGALIGLAGAAAGLALAPAVAHSLVRLMTTAEPGSEPYSASVDTRVLLFTLGLSIVVILLFSIAPVLHYMRPHFAEALRQNSGTASRSSQRFRKIAVGVQIALSVLLLGEAGLFVRTLGNLRHQNVGFVTSYLNTFNLDPTIAGYTEERTRETETRALEALRALPGVVSAAGTTDPELAGDSSFTGYTIQGYKPAEDEKMSFEHPWITPGYFDTLHQPLLAGRDFTPADTKGAPKVAIVNADFAKRFFGSIANALGRQVGEENKLDITIVGVVGNIKHQSLRDDIGPAVYVPYLQIEHPIGLQMYVRTAQSPERLQPAIRAVIHQIDPTLVVDGLRTMQEQIDTSAADERALAFLSIGFSGLAILIAAVGLYGVLAYSIEQRTREVGVRLALGATRSNVVLLMVREMFVIASVATALGLPASMIIARLFRTQLYGVTATDPTTIAAAMGITALMVFLAAALPAQRAAAVQPIKALRTE